MGDLQNIFDEAKMAINSKAEKPIEIPTLEMLVYHMEMANSNPKKSLVNL